MGLTIHYGLTTPESNLDKIRSLVQNFHALAKQLPFQDVEDVVEFQGRACGYANADDPDRWLKIQAGQYLDLAGNCLKVIPHHIIAFTTVPGEGSEPANFGLCRYPEFVQVERPARRRVSTQLKGWSWKSFCKTQYASDPAAGGTPNFLRCHLAIVALLDAIQKRGLAQVRVSDESDYWEDRDIRKLAETVGEWNQMIAAFAGQLKDAADGFQLDAPITQFANFERLEAMGRDKLGDQPS